MSINSCLTPEKGGLYFLSSSNQGTSGFGSTKLNDWLQILGMFGIMGSLVFVGLQVKQTDEIASLEGQEYAVQRHYDMLSLMTQFAEVWRRYRTPTSTDSSQDVGI